jgi:predicted transcriptional regulator
MSHQTLARLKRRAKRLGITQAAIAEAAGVKPTLICHVFAGRAKSRNVVRTARRLIAERAS